MPGKTPAPVFRQAIITRWLPLTNTRNSRIKATCTAGSVTIPYEHKMSRGANHLFAATALANKLQWLNPENGPSHTWCIVAGELPDCSGLACVLVPVPGTAQLGKNP